MMRTGPFAGTAQAGMFMIGYEGQVAADLICEGFLLEGLLSPTPIRGMPGESWYCRPSFADGRVHPAEPLRAERR